MKFMRLPLEAIFFMTNFYRAGGGGHGALAPPPGSATVLFSSFRQTGLGSNFILRNKPRPLYSVIPEGYEYFWSN